MEESVRAFRDAGGSFLTPAERLRGRVMKVSAFIFDWDGVFNAGFKGPGTPSPFSELDSMGTNLLRFGWWLKDGRLPPTAVITGQDNPAAIEMARRESLQAVYAGFLDKRPALDDFERRFGADATRIAYCFDDVLDLPVAARCGVRLMVRTEGAPLLRDYVERRDMADYLTARRGGEGAVREATELMLGLAGLYERTVDERCACSDAYASYVAARAAVEPLLVRPSDL